MAIILLKTNTLILEVPKTGSKWVRSAIQRSGIQWRQIGPSRWRGHGTLAIHGRGYSFIMCFVRNPVTWYVSYWAYKRAKGWNSAIVLDRECGTDDFASFVRSAAQKLPGILTTSYETYAGPSHAPINFIGRQENLADDLIQGLKLCGEVFDEHAIRTTPRVNQTSEKPEYQDELRELVVLSEYRAMERFGYFSDPVEPFGIRGILRRFPEDTDALLALAIHTEESHIEVDRRKALAGRPVHAGTRSARILSNFAMYMQVVKRDFKEAESLYQQAIAADPAHPRSLGQYAGFALTVHQNHDHAEHLYKRALEVRPAHAVNLGQYALFLDTIRMNTSAAKVLYEKAIDLNPNYAENLGRFAELLMREGTDWDRVQNLFERAVELDPQNATNLYNYAVFLSEIQNDDEAAEAYFRKAAASESASPEILLSCAQVLESINVSCTISTLPRPVTSLGSLDFTSIFGVPLLLENSLEQLMLTAKERLNSDHAFYVRGFPLDVELFVEFLHSFGELLENYASGADLPAYRLHPSINRVRHEGRQGGNLRYHEQGGELLPHSARSWSRQRPRYFAMLMINPGWINQPMGANGESVVVPWRGVLQWLERNSPDYENDFPLLTQVPLSFHANNVVEEISDLPLFYPLQDASSPLDLGVRLKVDLETKLDPGTLPSGYLPALRRFREACNLPVNRCCYQMDIGDLVFIDNNRFGHGRHSVVTKSEGLSGELNPRELWSVSMN